MITNKELAVAGFNGWESKIIRSLEERIESLEGEIKRLKDALTAEPNLINQKWNQTYENRTNRRGDK